MRPCGRYDCKMARSLSGAVRPLFISLRTWLPQACRRVRCLMGASVFTRLRQAAASVAEAAAKAELAKQGRRFFFNYMRPPYGDAGYRPDGLIRATRHKGLKVGKTYSGQQRIFYEALACHGMLRHIFSRSGLRLGTLRSMLRPSGSSAPPLLSSTARQQLLKVAHAFQSTKKPPVLLTPRAVTPVPRTRE